MKSTNNTRDLTDIHALEKHCLLPSEIEIFKRSVRNQLNSFTKPGLLNFIQLGQVTANLNAILSHTFSENDVYMIFSDFDLSLDYMVNEWHLAWIIGFKYFHCHVFPTTDEESPTKNPHWDEIISLDRTDLLSLLDDFMFPMFTDTFEVCYLDLMNDLGQ